MPNVTDFSPELRQAALRHVRTSVGDATYNDLISQYGEDGVLEVLLNSAAAEQQDSSTRSKARGSSAGIGWSLIMYALIGGASGLLAYSTGGDIGTSVVIGIVGLYVGRVIIGAVGSSKMSALLFGLIGLLLAAICAIAGIVFLFIPAFGWHYTALAFLIAVPLFFHCMILVAESTFQCENCGSKDTEVLDHRVGGPAYADSARATYRRCKQCGHTQAPFS